MKNMSANTKPKKKKKSVVNDAQTLKEYNEEKRRIRKQEARINKYGKGRRADVMIMQDEGEDKIVAQKIFLLASKGFSRKKIRAKLDMSVSMWDKLIRKYAEDFPIYKIALERGEMYALEEVEESLKSRALGYDYTEVTEDDMRGTKTVTKHVPPDTKAIMFYLTNKKPEEYKMKRDNEVVVTHKQDEIDYSKLDNKTLQKLMQAASNEQVTNIVKSLPSVNEDKDDDYDDEDEDDNS